MRKFIPVLGLSAFLLAGNCDGVKEDTIKEPKPMPYSLEIPKAYGNSSPDGKFCDIDCDGDMDYIITQSDCYKGHYKTRSYIFENDGEGYFKLRHSLAPIKIE